MEPFDLITNIEIIDNNNRTYTLKLPYIKLCEIKKGLAYMDKQRKASREHNRRKRLTKTTNDLTDKENLSLVDFLNMIDNNKSECELTVSSHELREIKKAIKYMETQRESSRKYLRKFDSDQTNSATKYLMLNIVNPV